MSDAEYLNKHPEIENLMGEFMKRCLLEKNKDPKTIFTKMAQELYSSSKGKEGNNNCKKKKTLETQQKLTLSLHKI